MHWNSIHCVFGGPYRPGKQVKEKEKKKMIQKKMNMVHGAGYFVFWDNIISLFLYEDIWIRYINIYLSIYV